MPPESGGFLIVKIILVCNNDLFLFPFLDKYLSLLKDKCKYKVLFWNRNENQFCPDHLIYKSYKNKKHSLFSKLLNYFGFVRFVKKELTLEKPDRVIVFNTQSMVLMHKFLEKRKIQFIFDYRDESHEKNPMYRKMVESCITDSLLTVFSSPGYLSLFNNIDPSKTVICHNNKYSSNLILNRKKNKKIVLTFWGMIRHEDYFLRLISKISCDNRFEIAFYGLGYSKLKERSDKIHSQNICFYGPYVEKEIPLILSKTDIAINAYPNNSVQKRSLTCKMYECIFSNTLMIVQKDSFMHKYL